MSGKVTSMARVVPLGAPAMLNVGSELHGAGVYVISTLRESWSMRGQGTPA
ncbi:MAG: hypothetical protein M3P11_07155 [Actinomycetota bacterium]|nr:hypothetical protein [Actinomycetota bacterium]